MPINSVIRSLPTGLDTNIALVTEKKQVASLISINNAELMPRYRNFSNFSS
jgi:hypothetical protein